MDKGTAFALAAAILAIALITVLVGVVVTENNPISTEKVSGCSQVTGNANALLSLPKPANNSLIAVATNSFAYAEDDKGSGSWFNLVVYRPTLFTTDTSWCWVGEVPGNAPGYPATPIQGQVSIMVKASDPDALKAPADWKCVWTSKDLEREGFYGSEIVDRTKIKCSLWIPVAPEGFVALGGVFVRGYDKPNGGMYDSFRCVNKKYCVNGTIKYRQWLDQGTHANQDGSIWLVSAVDDNGVNAWALWPSGSWNAPTDQVYCLNRQYLYEED